MSTARHTLRYRLLNHRPDDAPAVRKIDVHATPEELREFAATGVLVREALFQGEDLERLRDACDRIEAGEWDQHRSGEPKARSWGIILRYLEDKDPAFLDLVDFPPVLSIARAMMGPRVRLRGLSARISFPGAETQDTPWHQHLRVLADPAPPWNSEPHAIERLRDAGWIGSRRSLTTATSTSSSCCACPPAAS